MTYRYKIKKAGSYLGGILLQQDSYVLKANDGSNRVNGLLKDLSVADKELFLKIAVKQNIYRVKKDTQIALKKGFEYPASSGNFISITNEDAVQIKTWYELTNQQISLGQLSFPIFYVGTGDIDLNFQNQIELDSFYNSALSAFTMLNTSKFKTAYDAIKAVQFDPNNLINSVKLLEAIQY